MSFSTWIIWSLAAHVGIFHLNTEQSAICTHAELISLQTLIKVQISSRIRDARSIEHDWSIEHNAVLLQEKKEKKRENIYPHIFIPIGLNYIHSTICKNLFSEKTKFGEITKSRKTVSPLPQCQTWSRIKRDIKLSYSRLTALSSMPPPILNSTVRPIMFTPSFPRMMALLSPLMFRSEAALLVIWKYRKKHEICQYNKHKDVKNNNK